MIERDRGHGASRKIVEPGSQNIRSVFRKKYREPARIVFLAAFLCTALLSPAAAQMMSVPGGFNVNEQGAATYSIPIAVPPGTAGMVPSLSLDYSSQGGNGLVGVGWALSGLPSIGRCPKTQAQDGVRGTVGYDADDRFCMEGQRLVVISGIYGADGSAYRTELEGFSKVTAYGTAGNGPAWFEVKTKSGQTMEFGNTVDSRILAQGKTTARSWAVNKISDTAGNYLTITYTNDTTNGQAYPTRVDYTGNAGASLVPYNSVRFVYETRPDIAPLYHAGSKMETSVRLTNVRTYEGDNLVADYRLTYDTSPATSRSRVTSVELCDAAGASCLPATSFDYSVEAFPINVTMSTGTIWAPPGEDWQQQFGDFNGDGMSDVLWVGLETNNYTSMKRVIWLSKGDGTFQTIDDVAGKDGWYPVWDEDHETAGDYDFLVGDFNGDARSDIFLTPHPKPNGVCRTGTGWPGGACNTTFMWLSNGDGTFQVLTTTAPPYVDYNANKRRATLIADLDGDGRSDIFWLTVASGSAGRFNSTFNNGRIAGPATPWLSNGDGTFIVKPAVAMQSGWNSIGRLRGTEDFNGDGLPDFYFQNDVPTTSRQIWQSNGDGTFDVLTDVAGADGSANGWLISFGDFNGDGKSDLFRTNGTNRGLWLSRGDGTFRNIGDLNGANGTLETYVPYPVDVDGDGRTDILFVTGTQRIAWKSNGDGSFDVTTNYGGFDGVSTGTDMVAADITGDGKPDFSWQKYIGAGPYLWLSDPASVDLLVSFETGLGTGTVVNYDSLSRNFETCVVVFIPVCTPYLYEKDSDAVYPLVDIQGPLYVVESVEADDGIGGTYRSEYFYKGAKADLEGRGFLGFREWTVTDPQTEIVQTTEYLQSFPYIGMMASQTKKRGSQLLNLIENSYSHVSHSAGRRRVLLDQTVESSWDLDGSAVPPVTTAYTYDGYSNPTEIVVSTPDGATKTTVNSYTNNNTNWWLGRLNRSEVTSTVP